MIHFTGDINLTDWMFNVGFGIGTNIGKGLDPLKYLERKEGDLWVGNFEGVASPVSDNSGIYAKAFRVEPEVLNNVSHMDIYGLANNHAMEHGSEAYIETVKAIESYGSQVFGLRDKKSYIFEHQGQKISITGMCTRIDATKWEPLYWYNPEYKEIEAELSQLPTDAFKVLYIHWGNEYINRPAASQKKFAHWLIDAGFDLIIGMHPHVLQGYEDYKGKRIYYSLGNCVFDMPSEQCKIGAVVSLDLSSDRPKYSEQYIHLDNECCPHIVPETEIPSHWHFSFLNDRLQINDNSEEYHSEITKGYLVYRKANRQQILMSAFTHPKAFMSVLSDFIKRNF